MWLYKKIKSYCPKKTTPKNITNAIHHLWVNVDFYLALLKITEPEKPPYYQWIKPDFKNPIVNLKLPQFINQFKTVMKPSLRYPFIQCLIYHPKSIENGNIEGMYKFLNANPKFVHLIARLQFHPAIEHWYKECATAEQCKQRYERSGDNFIKNETNSNLGINFKK